MLPDPTLLVIAALLVPIFTELLTKSGLASDDAKATKRLVASVLTAVVMGAQIWLTGDQVPGLEEILAQFILLRTAVEGGHATGDGVLKGVGVDTDKVLFPGFGVGSTDRTD